MKFLASGPGTGTDTQVDPTQDRPFALNSIQKDDFAGNWNKLPSIREAKWDDDLGVLSIPLVVDTDDLASNYGYLVYVGEDELTISPIESQLSRARNGRDGFLIVTPPKKPVKIKVTILTKKEVTVNLT